MEIRYMKKMAKTPRIDDSYNNGISEEQIAGIESAIGRKFPLAFREFLFLGGNGANMIADSNNGCFLDEEPYWRETQENARAVLAEDNFVTEKDFWVFAETDGCEQFNFIYFDEGDDPPVYLYVAKEYPDPGIEKCDDKFSDFINSLIDYRKREGY